MLNQTLGLLAGGRHGCHIFRVIGKNIVNPHELNGKGGTCPGRLFPRQSMVY